MRNTDTKLVNTLKKLYQGHEYTTTFEDEVMLWNEPDAEYIEEWEIKYYLILREVLGTGLNAIATFDVIITDIIVDGDDMYHRWEDDDFDENTWYIIKVDEDLYDTIGKDFPISLYFNFYNEDEYNNLPSE
jgi:hypothetical protein